MKTDLDITTAQRLLRLEQTETNLHGLQVALQNQLEQAEFAQVPQLLQAFHLLESRLDAATASITLADWELAIDPGLTRIDSGTGTLETPTGTHVGDEAASGALPARPAPSFMPSLRSNRHSRIGAPALLATGVAVLALAWAFAPHFLNSAPQTQVSNIAPVETRPPALVAAKPNPTEQTTPVEAAPSTSSTLVETEVAPSTLVETEVAPSKPVAIDVAPSKPVEAAQPQRKTQPAKTTPAAITPGNARKLTQNTTSGTRSTRKPSSLPNKSIQARNTKTSATHKPSAAKQRVQTTRIARVTSKPRANPAQSSQTTQHQAKIAAAKNAGSATGPTPSKAKPATAVLKTSSAGAAPYPKTETPSINPPALPDLSPATLERWQDAKDHMRDVGVLEPPNSVSNNSVPNSVSNVIPNNSVPNSVQPLEPNQIKPDSPSTPIKRQNK